MCNAESFIKAWQTSDNRKDVVKKTGMGVGAVDARAAYYRHRGVPLKSLKANKQPYNWQALASLARRLAA